VRFSVTLLESIRRHFDGLLSTEQLVARILGRDPLTWRVEMGRAYDALLQEPARYQQPGGYRVDGPGYSRPWVFEEQAVAPALALIPSHDDPCRFQPKRVAQYGEHTVVAKADHLVGFHVDEFKTRVGDFDPATYHDSVQWRFLLELFGADSVTYRVFRLSDPKDGPPALLAIETITLHRYAALREECRAHVDACAQWVLARGLWSELMQPSSARAASEVVVAPRALPRAPRSQPARTQLPLFATGGAAT
jgi:hypothetical protein